MSETKKHILTDAEAGEIIAAGTRPWELVRLADPDISMGAAVYVLWERTPFPMIAGVHDLVDHLAANFEDIDFTITPQDPTP